LIARNLYRITILSQKKSLGFFNFGKFFFFWDRIPVLTPKLYIFLFIDFIFEDGTSVVYLRF